MAFGQQAGPPATGRQVQELLSLLVSAGHRDFRDARGPMGFTQRQAGGRFTREEADAFIARLQETGEGDDASAAPADVRGAGGRSTGGTAGADTGPGGAPGTARGSAPAPSAASPAAIAQVLRHMPTDALADELRRRGCMVIEP